MAPIRVLTGRIRGTGRLFEACAPPNRRCDFSAATAKDQQKSRLIKQPTPLDNASLCAFPFFTTTITTMAAMERPLPPGHFLALPPSYAQPSDPSSSGTSSHASNGLAPNVASLAAADYDVDVRTGFLPGSKNIERLPASWDLWEDALAAARSVGLRLGGPREQDRLWRQGIEMVSPRPDLGPIGA